MERRKQGKQARRGMPMAVKSPREVTASIIAGIDVLAEYRALGVEIVGEPRSSGMVSCRAFGREDRRPSAWVNCKSGFYGDAGGKETAASTCSLFDFAAKVGKFADWKEARKFYAQKAGIELGRGTQPGKDDWHNRLLRQSWDTPGNDVLALRWCTKHKPGVTVEAIKAAGGQMAYFPCHWDKDKKEVVRNTHSRQVIAIPCYGEWLLDAESVAWVCWDITGADIETKTGPVKMVSVGPTRGTLMGLSSLMVLLDPERRQQVELVWKVEGPADMLALWAAIPEELRDRYVVITNGGGATSDVLTHQSKLLAGRTVAICGDCDEAGQVGAAKWVKALGDLVAEVRNVLLPWPIDPSHGKDVRDFLTGALLPGTTTPQNPPAAGGRPYSEIMALYTSSPAWQPTSGPASQNAAGATLGPLEAISGSIPGSAYTITDDSLATFESGRY